MPNKLLHGLWPPCLCETDTRTRHQGQDSPDRRMLRSLFQHTGATIPGACKHAPKSTRNTKRGEVIEWEWWWRGSTVEVGFPPRRCEDRARDDPACRDRARSEPAKPTNLTCARDDPTQAPSDESSSTRTSTTTCHCKPSNSPRAVPPVHKPRRKTCEAAAVTTCPAASGRSCLKEARAGMLQGLGRPRGHMALFCRPGHGPRCDHALSSEESLYPVPGQRLASICPARC